MTKKLRTFLFLHLTLLLYSFASVCSKLAAQQQMFSFWNLAFYGMSLGLVGLYAILWQQVLKRLPLSTAFVNKSVTILWGTLWGALLFQEQIKLNMLVGMAIVFTGVFLVVTADEK